MRILVVAEGRHELNLGDGEPTNGPLVRLISRVLCERFVGLIEFERRQVSSLTKAQSQLPGRAANYQRRALVWMREAQNQGFDAIVLVVDQDAQTDRRKGLDAAQADSNFWIRRALGLAVESFDAWLLADEQAISKATQKTVQRQKPPELIRGAKAVLHALIEDADEPRTTVYLKIAEYTRIETLCERCPMGFLPFHNRLIALVSSAS